ncbi:hypothetical protein E3N88_32292 [Mikania micrantha]|uniref:HAT C-terminal dimerisation domain-containing protein n=1 Tax=Mikania micrantha TaxID=192012 RepID=A0A5N6M8S6_9ASTR|nr:hypothetical protein E3N88_32292 [Mikania micrantha]
MKYFRRLFPNDDEYRRVLDEYAMFSMKSGTFENLSSIAHMATIEPKNWRNKLTTSRAQDLVYIHNNLILLSRNSNGDVKMWEFENKS